MVYAEDKSVITREDVSLSVRAPIKQEDEQEEQELKHAYSISNKSSTVTSSLSQTMPLNSGHVYLTTHSQSGQSESNAHASQGTSPSGSMHQVASHSPSDIAAHDSNMKNEVR